MNKIMSKNSKSFLLCLIFEKFEGKYNKKKMEMKKKILK